ncbi:hypothetical protein SAMN05192545_3928 [Maribacter dokdonensis]|uniref:Uncharacterized protein n=1 Tax=Maribacter dokdonensis TaxID=320912 RepID=A0ABY0V0M2_9FLAO|nr:hypothetical protein [Maribacter dokdonensis]SDT47297.1 hypothetical protein SAMN05192545_3928 [Maribacter dokdonensis]
MQFRLKANRKYLFDKRKNDILSNANMTRARALRFIAANPELRKPLFDKLPADIDEQIEARTRKDK